MDCEKFESLLIDELYEELDEVTSAAVKRHASGCARCGALLSGLRATRKVAAVPLEEPSPDLEDRILSAVREQQKVVPFPARAAGWLSRAGAWAMRPQTAMAAVFLVVIGTSFVLVQSRKSPSATALSAGEGAPVVALPQAAPGAANASALALDNNESAFAHGVEQRETTARRAGPVPSITTLLAEESAKDAPKPSRGVDDLTSDKKEVIANAGPIGGAAAATMNAPPPPPAERAYQYAPQAQAATGGGGSGRWDQSGAALADARAEKNKSGCTPDVIQRYEQLRAQAGGSQPGNDATLDVARCYRSTGDIEKARARYSALLQQQGYSTTAQSELDQMAPAVAAHKAAPMQATPRAVTTTPPATPPATQTKASY